MADVNWGVDMKPEQDCDLAIIGTGPAGMEAAAVAARHGLSVSVFDEQPAPGGQIYRGIASVSDQTLEALGADYAAGAGLLSRMRASGARIFNSATVWNIDPDGTMAINVGGRTVTPRARRLLVATGAQERPFPIPGWTLPGVMTAGAAQILLKQADLVPQYGCVIAGTGPLLWLLAWQVLRAGGQIDLILDTTPRDNRRRALPYLPSFLTSSYALKGLRLLAFVRRKVRVVSAVEAVEAIGAERVEAVRYRLASGTEVTVPCQHLLLHQGVIPSLHVPETAGCDLRWNEAMACFEPEVDEWGASRNDLVAVAGDAAGIAGARAAAHRGRLAALDAAFRLGRIERNKRDAEAAGSLAWLNRDAKARRFIDAMYLPAPSFRVARGDTIVCRCEEISASTLERAIDAGALGPNQAKFFLRCGMGPCQGRMCGATVTEMFAQKRQKSPEEIGTYRLRTPIKPVTVEEMACVPYGEPAKKAVIRL